MDDYSMDGLFDDWDSWEDVEPTEDNLADDPLAGSDGYNDDQFAQPVDMGALSDTPFQSALPDWFQNQNYIDWILESQNQPTDGNPTDAHAGDDPNTPPPGSKTEVLEKMVVTAPRPKEPEVAIIIPPTPLPDIEVWIGFDPTPEAPPEPAAPPPAPPRQQAPDAPLPPMAQPLPQQPPPEPPPASSSSPRPPAPTIPKIPPKPSRPVLPVTSTSAENGDASSSEPPATGAILVAAAGALLLFALSRRRSR